MRSCTVKTLLCLLVLIVAVGACYAANNRPLIFGMNPTPMSWWGKDPNVWDPMLYQKMRDAGCTSCRLGVGWDGVEAVQGVYNWTEADRLINLALDNNIEPVLLINSTPVWALQSDYDPNIDAYVARYPPDVSHSDDFQRYVYDLVRRFRGRVRYYEFWNEANGYGWYTALQNPPTYSRADQYTPWMIRAYKSVKLADPTAQMSTTGIDDGGEGHAPYYLEQIYAHGGKGYFDAVADHPYPMGGLFQDWKLSDIRSTLDNHGDTHVNVWITEFGYNWSNFQNEMNYYFNKLILDDYDYVKLATWHTANVFPWEAGYGLLNSDLSAKPEYNTFKNYPKPGRPVISGVSATLLSPTSARINFTTNMPAKGLVMYGNNKNYGKFTSRETAAGTSHSITLLGLTPNTSYRYRVRAGAVEDGDAFSADYGFTTSSGNAVQITHEPVVSSITETGAIVSWSTNVSAAASLEYGTDFSYGSNKSASGTRTNHAIQVTGLQPGTVYQVRVRSTAAGYADAYAETAGFRTLGERIVHVTSGPVVYDTTDNSAVIAWTTDIPSNSCVQYGPTPYYGKSVRDNTYTTNHVIPVSSLLPGTVYYYKIISGAASYMDVEVGDNSFTTLGQREDILINGGFEDNTNAWTYWEVYPWGKGEPVDWPGHIGYSINGGVKKPTPGAMEGNNRVTGEAGWCSGVGGLYQTVSVPNGTYLVSGWVAANCDGGSEFIELIAQDGLYTGGIPAGVIVGQLTSTANWTYFVNAIDVTTGKLTVATRASQWWATDVVTGHFDGISVTPTTRQSINAVKKLTEGLRVTTNTGYVVTAVIDANTFYMQAQDRSCGIKVKTMTPHGLTVSKNVAACGTLRVLDGEVVIDQATVASAVDGVAATPLAISNLALGGARNGLQPAVGEGVGVSNIGLLVKTWGRVSSATSTSFVVNDGSGAGVKCLVAGADTLVQNGGYVTVVGISSCEAAGGSFVPVVRLRGAEDVRPAQ